MQRPAALGAGFDRCQHYGCQVDYATADNHAQAPLVARAAHSRGGPSRSSPSPSAQVCRHLRFPRALALSRRRHHPNQACCYHPGAPIFHEGSKQWPCCGVKKWDFDDFMAVPGCVVAMHEPVVWDN